MARCYLAVSCRRKQIQSIILCQAMARRHLVLNSVKLETTSAIAIQSFWRGFMASVEYSLTRFDVIIIQALFRRKVAVASFKSRSRAILCIQSAARHWLARCRKEALMRQREEMIRKEAALQNTCAGYIQAAFRGRVVRRELQLLAVCATTIQSGCRAFLACLNYQMQLVDIILVQSAIRGWSARAQYKNHSRAILDIQKFLRLCLAKREMQRLRCIQEEVTREHQAATMIQKTWRCFTIHIDYMLLILSAISIQALVRQHQALVKCKKLQHGIVALQSLARGVSERNFHRRLERCAIVIQSRTRAFISHSSFRHAVAAAISIQRLSRGFLARVDIDLKNFAACEIQRIWRGYQQNVDYLLQVIAVITIQSSFRSALAKCELQAIRRIRFLETVEMRFREKKAMMIQRAFRAYVRFKLAAKAASILQATTRGILCRLQIGRMFNGIITLQSRWRGRSTRFRMPKKARVIAKRLAEANFRALENPSMRLGVRTASALLVLQNSTRLVEIMNAVATLETSTRLSRNCCIAFTECDAPEIVYSLVRTCNRSLPHVELLHYVLLTLSNVANHNELLWRVSTEESVEVYMDLVQMFRDKDNVFCLAVTLLYKAIAKNCDLKVSGIGSSALLVCIDGFCLPRLGYLHSEPLRFEREH